MVSTDERDLDLFISIFFPHPVRFRKEWSQVNTRAGATTSPLYVWNSASSVAPSDDYVTLGVVATTDGLEPPLSSMRCVPRYWCNSIPQEKVSRLWSNAGLGGAEACLYSSARDWPSQFEVASGSMASLAPELFAVAPGAQWHLELPEKDPETSPPLVPRPQEKAATPRGSRGSGAKDPGRAAAPAVAGTPAAAQPPRPPVNDEPPALEEPRRLPPRNTPAPGKEDPRVAAKAEEEADRHAVLRRQVHAFRPRRPARRRGENQE
ncbi:unnamed protein product [Prorocentrum cordatum]|uniref:Uncharacterized protein n=1 Tax=Prorocentrum cordatum TaxID=2364126 RepID=A0ABN9U8T6_9DINO|nr:unnamed protein product [Polarella glacialis]